LIQGNNPITDVIIGSVQSGENFKVFAGNSANALNLIASGTGGTASCTPGPMGATCEVTGFSDLFVGVQTGGIGDVTLVAVSQPTVSAPEPASLALLGRALAGLGFGSPPSALVAPAPGRGNRLEGATPRGRALYVFARALSRA